MKRLLMFLMLMMLCVPLAHGEDEQVWINAQNADRVHLRREAAQDAESLGLYYTGTTVRVREWLGDWAYVTVGEVSGFMMSGFLSHNAVSLAGPWRMVENPSSAWVNLRRTPAMTGEVMVCPENGTAVLLLGETSDGWSYVTYDGMYGYIRTSLLSAEIASVPQSVTILAQENIDRFICAYVAPNGQTLCFTALMHDPYITFEDVNFDGFEDIVVLVNAGVSNGFYAFFVYDAQTDAYQRAFLLDGEETLCNYRLDPDTGIVISHGSNGFAGALHEISLYRWKGTELHRVRRAVSEELTVTTYQDGVFTTTMYDQLLHMSVQDSEANVLWEKTIPLTDDAFLDAFEEEEAALWQGIG